MNLTVKLFGELQELCDNSSIQLQLPAHSCVGDLLLTAGSQYDIFNDRVFRVAVNCSYVDESHSLSGGDEIAFIPAVCGG
ncbi:MAG: MoaD/ThiS family protein [Planctomycetes bacterium]|nr:MoaD/ThiS family protein [Planctomycetota bacterium]